MRVVQFLQVVVLLLLLAYSVLVYLVNPVLLRLPLLFAGRELVLPAGLALGLGLLAGALYATLLILPRYLRQRVLRRGDLIRRRDAETRLRATLQAVVDGTALGEMTAGTAAPENGGPDPSGPAADAEAGPMQTLQAQPAVKGPAVQA